MIVLTLKSCVTCECDVCGTLTVAVCVSVQRKYLGRYVPIYVSDGWLE